VRQRNTNGYTSTGIMLLKLGSAMSNPEAIKIISPSIKRINLKDC